MWRARGRRESEPHGHASEPLVSGARVPGGLLGEDRPGDAGRKAIASQRDPCCDGGDVR